MMKPFFVKFLFIFLLLNTSSFAMDRIKDSIPEVEKEVAPEEVSHVIESIEAITYAFMARDVAKIYYQLSSDELRKAATLETIREMLIDTPVLEKPASLNLYSMVFHKDHVIAQGEMMAYNNISFNVRYHLVKEEGMWKLAGIWVFSSDQHA